ncbi:zinc-binding alcohol dehydrogenase [Gryllotalpicola reticulitermitis]|uniref:Zinc-binding alcohol dehydrogenase n=1 Tax=Gryllotalpicola reticulitermitis TaxID=1184153 RepID=A0ABV8Q952_9MICO
MDTQSGSRSVHSPGQHTVAFWTTGPGRGELRAQPLAPPSAAELRVRTLWTGVSRGTESLVARGDVPESEWQRMRAPFQDGEFPFPVKYGYLNVGVVEEGPGELIGQRVFTLFPHQAEFVVPVTAVTVVPEAVPARRAVLAGAVETAVNVLWDAGPMIGDRIAVIGAGMIGCSIARLARGIPGARVTLIDVEPSRADVAASLGVDFCVPDGLTHDYDVVIEASGTDAGVALALRAAPDDGEVIVASWIGARMAQLPLGADFHSRRLTLRASQVGAVAPRRRTRRTTHSRLELALDLLADPAFDVLLSGISPWGELPAVMARLADGSSRAEFCHTISWEGA